MLTVKWFQVFPSNTNNSVQLQSFVNTLLNVFKHCNLIVILFPHYSYVI